MQSTNNILSPMTWFDKEAFKIRFETYVRCIIQVNYQNMIMHGQELMQEQQDLSWSIFLKVSWSLKTKGIYEASSSSSDLYDSYKRLLTMGHNQLMAKLRLLFDEQLPQFLEIMKSNMIITETVNEIADDIEELLKDNGYATDQSAVAG